MAVTEQTAPRPAPLVGADVDERAARATLRAQVAHLERELTAARLDACPRLAAGPPLGSLAGPRLLSLGDLERVRDALADRVTTLHRAAEAQTHRQAEARDLLAHMLVDPPAYKRVRVSNEDLGEPGCKHFHVRPHLGPIGLLLSWWRVMISSGCPLAWGA